MLPFNQIQINSSGKCYCYQETSIYNFMMCFNMIGPAVITLPTHHPATHLPSCNKPAASLQLFLGPVFIFFQWYFSVFALCIPANGTVSSVFVSFQQIQLLLNHRMPIDYQSSSLYNNKIASIFSAGNIVQFTSTLCYGFILKTGAYPKSASKYLQENLYLLSNRYS